jgi:hypothetical protein
MLPKAIILILIIILIYLSILSEVRATNLISNPSFEGATTQVDVNNTNFEFWNMSRSPDNGIIKTWVETNNVKSGNKALHWKVEAPDPTSISFSYYSDYFSINESEYIEAGFWGFLISTSYGYSDVSLYFYDVNNNFLGRIWAKDQLGSFQPNTWNRISFLWYPSSLGSEKGYIAKGAVKARLNIYCNWHYAGADERIDDDFSVRQYDYLPSLAERMEWNLTDAKLSADFSELQGTSILSYASHPTEGDEDFRTGGKDQLVWNIIKQFNFSKMRFQSGYLFSSSIWFTEPICLYWNETTNSCDESNINFENWRVAKNSDNGFIKTWVETMNTHSGSKALHFYTQAPSPTSLSLAYYSDYFPIDESKYYEAGFWSYPIQGSRNYDVTLHFYDENKNFLARLWGRDDLGSFSQGQWKSMSSLWYPSSFGSGNGYIPAGAKYAKLNIFINWHVPGVKEAIDDDTFVREFSSKPSTDQRQTEVTNNLVSNPSFDGDTCVFYWNTLDQMIEAVKNVGGEPIISLPVGTWGNANYMPDGMPLNKSIYVSQWTYNKGYYPTLNAYCKLVKDVINHTNIERGYNVKYWEIGNEPPADENDTVIMAYVDLFNLAEKCMHEIDSTVLIGTDRSDMRDFMNNYFVKYANNVGFLSFHNYDTGGSCMYPSNSTNLNNVYYPPNDQNGWAKDETIMFEVNNLNDSRIYSPKELKDFWKENRGQDLEVINTEINMNSAWRNGSDPRMNNLLGATWYAAKVRAYILDGGASVLNYFVIMSWETDQPTSKYGALGFGMMNSSYPYNPYAPYWTNYLLTKYVPKGSLIYNSTSNYPDLIDLLAVKAGDSYNILLINKFNETVSFSLSLPGLTVKDAKLYLLDGTTYIQRYEPSLDKTMIYKSDIYTIQLPASNVQNLVFNGYTVAVLQVSPLIISTTTSQGPAPGSGSAPLTSSTTTSTRTSTKVTTAAIDYTRRCLDAGGECKTNCLTETTGSFLDNIANWFANLFSGSKSSSTGGMVSSSSLEEIGSYPEYCTEQLPKCCKKILITATTTSVASTTTGVLPKISFSILIRIFLIIISVVFSALVVYFGFKKPPEPGM